MICYSDKTFCNRYGATCGNDKCHRAFTDDRRIRAIQWWGEENPPVAFGDMMHMGCGFVSVEDTDKPKEPKP